MLPTEGNVVVIGGGGSGGRFFVGRLDMVGSEDIKLVCNGENGRRTEMQSGISILRIVLEPLITLQPLRNDFYLVHAPYRSEEHVYPCPCRSQLFNASS